VNSKPDINRYLLMIYRHLELSDQMRTILDLSVEWAGASVGYLFTVGENPELFTRKLSSLPHDDPRHRAVLDITRSDLPDFEGEEALVRRLGPVNVDPDIWKEKDRPEWSVLLPVMGERTGMVAVILLGGVVKERGGRDAVRQLLNEARPAIDNGRHVEEMKDLIIQDDTASCFNRRHFEDSLPVELARAARFGAPLSMIFFDMDNLKLINTNHGHAMGSRSLYEVSLRVRSKIRKFDKLFRFGGDEFCILLPETEWHGALEVAERVREAIAGRPFLQGLISDPEGVSITASMGISSYPLHARTREDMVVRADRAMQRIKNGTKNSIAIAEIQGGEHD
jgi:diguanylate cyclase (GGDEF)-like protein